jgi:hypothetical protein
MFELWCEVRTCERKALFTRNYSKETERLRELPNSGLGDSAYVIQWRFSDGATGGEPSTMVRWFPTSSTI